MEQVQKHSILPEQPTKEEIKRYVHRNWHHNQYMAKFNLTQQLGVTGEARPEIERQPRGEWLGKVHFDASYNVEVAITFRHQPNKVTAMDRVEQEVAKANAPVIEEKPISERQQRAG